MSVRTAIGYFLMGYGGLFTVTNFLSLLTYALHWVVGESSYEYRPGIGSATLFWTAFLIVAWLAFPPVPHESWPATAIDAYESGGLFWFTLGALLALATVARRSKSRQTSSVYQTQACRGAASKRAPSRS